MAPWRKQGYHGWFFDRRASGVHQNLAGLPVFSAGLACSSDAFNYFSLSGRKYSVNATFVGLGCLSPTLLRRLRSWYLATLGLPGAAWELDILPLMKIIRRLQNGCKAEISIGDKQTVTALVRLGLLTANLDSPMHSLWTNQKHHNAKTERACQACVVPRRDLGNPKYDIVKNARTADGLREDLDRVAATEKKQDRDKLSRALGVVVPRYPNPLDEVAFDRVEGCGMDILHQSALNSGKKIMGFVMEALDPAGSEIVRARLAWRRMLPPNVSPIADITSAGGWSALTGQQLWLVSSIFPFLLAPIFSSSDNLGRYVRTMIVTEVADRISVDPGTPAGKAAVCNAFQALVKACSWSCFVVRSPSFTAEGLRVLQKSQEEQVKQATRVMGVALGTIHKGLHIARNVVVNGVVTNCNVGEAKNKELKASATSASGRDNARHIWRATNDSLAIKALADGIEWTASGWTGSKWERRTVTAGDLCRRTLQDVFSVLPLAPALADTLSAGRPWGYVEWDEDLVGTEAPRTGVDGTDWQSVLRETLPTALQLEALYKDKLGCGREESGPLCNDDVCAFCWRDVLGSLRVRCLFEPSMDAEGLNDRGCVGGSIVDARWRGGRKDHRGDGGCGWEVVDGEHYGS
ncbi:unnamed protein product [Ectocarpus sp. 13 AM-2016]